MSELKNMEKESSSKLIKFNFKFDDYRIGTIYRDAHLSKIELPESEIQKILSWLKSNRGILTFVGNPGVGKTYLCASILNEWLAKGFNVRYYNERNFFDLCRKTIQQDWNPIDEINRICETPYFILDDIGSGQMTDWQKEILFAFLDTRMSSNMPTIITSNIFTHNMGSVFGERFQSRVKDKNNTLIELDWIDKRQE